METRIKIDNNAIKAGNEFVERPVKYLNIRKSSYLDKATPRDPSGKLDLRASSGGNRTLAGFFARVIFQNRSNWIGAISKRSQRLI